MFAIKWLGINILLSLILAGLANNYDIQNYIIWIFSAYFALVMVIKVIFVLFYLVQYNIFTRFRVSRKIKQMKNKNISAGIVQDKNRLKNFI